MRHGCVGGIKVWRKACNLGDALHGVLLAAGFTLLRLPRGYPLADLLSLVEQSLAFEVLVQRCAVASCNAMLGDLAQFPD